MPNPYVPTTWVDNTTAITAARLNNMETGISDASVQGYAAIAKPASPATTQVLAYNGTIWTGLALTNTHVSATADIAASKLLAGAADTVLQSNGTTNSFATTTGANARVAVGKNGAATTGTRRKLNLIEGNNITLTVADNAGAESVDVTITGASPPQGVPSGAIMDFAGTAAPTGWLLCDGRSDLLRSGGGFDALFAAIGTTYGAVDGAHFSVPDTRGRIIIGKGTNIDLNSLGGTESGVSPGTLPVGSRTFKHYHGLGTLAARVPDHTHGDTISFSDSGHSHSLWNGSTTVSVDAFNHTGGTGNTGTYNNPPNSGADRNLINVVGTNSGTASLGKTGSVGSVNVTGSPSVTPALAFTGSVGTTAAIADFGAYIILNQIIKI